MFVIISKTYEADQISRKIYYLYLANKKIYIKLLPFATVNNNSCHS